MGIRLGYSCNNINTKTKYFMMCFKALPCLLKLLQFSFTKGRIALFSVTQNNAFSFWLKKLDNLGLSCFEAHLHYSYFKTRYIQNAYKWWRINFSSIHPYNLHNVWLPHRWVVARKNVGTKINTSRYHLESLSAFDNLCQKPN